MTGFTMHNTDLLPALKALAHETRLRMIELLLTHNLCVRALAASLHISEAAASQHLQILRKAGLVKGEKQGYWTHYAVQTDALARLGERIEGMPSQSADFRDLNLDLCATSTSGQNEGGD